MKQTGFAYPLINPLAKPQEGIFALQEEYTNGFPLLFGPEKIKRHSLNAQHTLLNLLLSLIFATSVFMKSVTVRIAGANGDGVESSGALLIKVAAQNGMHVFGYRGYQSIIRGGHVWYQVRVSDQKLTSHGDDINILIAFNQDAINNQRSHLSEHAIIIYDPSKAKVLPEDEAKYKTIKLPMIDMAVQVSGDPIMRNVVSIGAAIKLLGIEKSVIDDVLRGMFGRKGADVVNSNIKAADMGYNFEGLEKAYDIPHDSNSRYTMDGNTALSIGAYAADCKFYAAYPMTPASSILHWFAAHANNGVLCKQTEDEIAAINMAIGASSAGVRAMCGTSGGGFSLMVEGLGLAGMLEVPLVVVESQRTGPSTGLPTKTEQADLLFVMHSSQGEFPRIVVAPRSASECFEVAAEAFNLADRYQCPVIILTDLFMSEHIESIDGFDLDKVMVDRGKVTMTNTAGGRFKRYLLTEDGVSPRALPGTPNMEFVAGSDEHDEYGDLVSDALSGIDKYVEIRERMHEKRMKKLDTMLANESIFVPHLDFKDSDFYLVTFGSTTEAVREAVDRMRSEGMKAGIISFNYIMPLDKGETKRILSGKRLIDVECNFTSQLAQVIMANTGIEIKDKILKYNGEAITPGDIVSQAKAILGK